jgi:hypothetical protein
MNICEKRQIDGLTAHGENAVVGSCLLRRSGQRPTAGFDIRLAKDNDFAVIDVTMREGMREGGIQSKQSSAPSASNKMSYGSGPRPGPAEIDM